MGFVIECDLRHMFGPVRDQGERPTCLAFAASDAHAATRAGNWEVLSCEYAYFHALKRDGNCRASGISLQGMLSAIREDGQPPESECPYLLHEPMNDAQWRPPPDASPIYRRASEYRGASVGAIRRRLGNGVPIIAIICLSAAFFAPDSDGIIAANEPPDPQIRHAVIAVGYGTWNGHRFILVRNSWGQGWGLSGHAWVKETYLVPRLYFIAEMTEDLTNVCPNSNRKNMRSGVA